MVLCRRLNDSNAELLHRGLRKSIVVTVRGVLAVLFNGDLRTMIFAFSECVSVSFLLFRCSTTCTKEGSCVISLVGLSSCNKGGSEGYDRLNINVRGK